MFCAQIFLDPFLSVQGLRFTFVKLYQETSAAISLKHKNPNFAYGNSVRTVQPFKFTKYTVIDLTILLSICFSATL